MADYTSTVELLLNGLEKLKQAEDRIKRLDGKNVKIKFDVDSSGLEKVKGALGGGNGKGGGSSNGGVASGVRGYFNEYNKAIKEGFKATEGALKAGEKTYLRSALEKQSNEYFKEAERIKATAQKELGDKYKDFEKASNNAFISARDESNRRQEAIAAKQVQQHFDNIDKAERIAAERSAKEQEKIAKQVHAERQKGIEKAFSDSAKSEAIKAKEDAKEIRDFEKEYRAIAEDALKNQTRLRNASRNYIGTSPSARNNLNAKADAYNDTINSFLNDKDVSQAERDSFRQKVGFANNAASTGDAIKEESVAYRQASNQAKLYKKELNDLYSSYTNIRKQAIKANVGSSEQMFLNREALDRLDEYNSRRSEVESSLSAEQVAQLDYMEQKSNLGLRDAAVTRRAAIDAKVTNQQYQNILDSQRRINSLQLDRSKISEKETDLYGKYTDAIDKAKQEQAGMISSYGQMQADQKAELANLKQEGVYRKENYDLLHQVSALDKDISKDYFEARLNANSKMKGIYKSDIEEVRGLYANAQNETDMQYASKREQALFARAAAQGNNGLSLIDKFKNGISSFTTMLVGPMALFRYGVTAAKAVMSNVTQMDAAMTELYKVTDNSQHEYDKFRTATEKTSAEIGSTQVALVQSTATFARLGYNLSDSAELGKNAALFSNVGDEGMTSTEAAEDMVAIMKGFNIQAEDSIHIVDALNQVGNRFSISSTGLGESLKRSGGAMATANNTLEETIGLTVAANDAMQDPASTGTALRTIALRLRGRHTCLHI